MVYLGGKLPIIDYITPATQELADEVGKNLINYDAVLLRKHGVTVVGKNLRETWIRSILIEETAKMIVAARAIGEDAAISPEEVEGINIDL